MNDEFQKKLQLYKEGKLSQNEVSEIECELDKFTAMMDYLNEDDKEFLEDLRQQIPTVNEEENKPAKLLKRRVNLRIIMISAISVFSILIMIIFLYFSTSKIVASLFGLNYKEAYVKRATMVQFAQMFNPQYESPRSGVDKLPFAQQNIHIFLDNTAGNTLIDATEIKVRYSFGRPVRLATPIALKLLPMEAFYSLNIHESDPISGFKSLEKAPQGTKAKIFIKFNKALSPQQLKEHFINQISAVDTTPLEFKPLTEMGSPFVLANPSYYQFTPVFPYGNTNNTRQVQSNNLKQTLYENMDNQAHKESFISNLNLIKSNKRLLQVMYYEDMFEDVNIDDVITQVEKNGIEYVGMYISADSKELLKLKGNPMIYSVRVDAIVVW